MMPPTPVAVSVVIPTYGHHSPALAAVVRAWLAQDTPCEVLIAHTGTAPPVPPHPRVALLQAAPGRPAPGRLRNHAAAHARAPVLYLTDADVAPLGTAFLTRAVRLSEDGALCQPWMYRLVDGAQALARVDLSAAAPCGEHCFVTTAGGELTPVEGDRVQRRSTAGASTAPYGLVPETFSRAQGQRRSHRAAFHWGGVILPRLVFDRVGGYCPLYTGWGCEDDDLLVKLSHVVRVERAWQRHPDLATVHAEHDYGRVHSPDHQRNLALFKERVRQGAAVMIAADTRPSPPVATNTRS